MLRAVDQLERDYQLIKERAVKLVQSKGIQVPDQKDIEVAAEVFLDEKAPQQLSYACKALLNENSKTTEDFLSKQEVFLHEDEL